MTDLQLRILERLASSSSGTPEIYAQYFNALCRTHGWSREHLQQMSRLLEIRNIYKVYGTTDNHSFRLFRMMLNQRGWLGPRRSITPMTAAQLRNTLYQFSQSGSQVRNQLANFIRLARSDPRMAQTLRAGIAAGGIGSYVRLVGGHMARHAFLRAGMAMTQAGTAMTGFLMSPAGLVIGITVALLLVTAIGIWAYNQPTHEERQVAAINCDCANINAGLLNVGFIPACRDHENALLEKVAAGNFALLSDNGKISGGTVCSFPSGPNAWPRVGASSDTPATGERDTDSCRQFEGISQKCVDR